MEFDPLLTSLWLSNIYFIFKQSKGINSSVNKASLICCIATPWTYILSISFMKLHPLTEDGKNHLIVGNQRAITSL